MSFSLKGQEVYEFAHLNSSDGLSQSSVITIDQDAAGVMWIGTRDGLNTYDGEHFQVHRNTKGDTLGLSNNDILEVDVDESGGVWVGTTNGLNYFNTVTERYTQFFNEPNNPNSIPNNTIRELLSSPGFVWVGTGRGLSLLNLKDSTFQNFVNDPTDDQSLTNDQVNDIYKDKSGNIWIGTSGGLNKATLSKEGIVELLPFRIDGLEVCELNIQTITQVPGTEQLVLGTRGNGVFIIDTKTASLVKSFTAPEITHPDVRSVVYDEEGNLWVGTYDGINIISQKGTVEWVRHEDGNERSLSRNTIKCIYKDKQGGMWIGTYYGGISIYNKAIFNFRNIKAKSGDSGLSYNVVSSITSANDELYLATEGGGITIIKSRDEYKYLNSTNSELPSDNVKCLSKEGDELLIGTYNRGASIYNLETASFTRMFNEQAGLTSPSVYGVLKVKGYYWVGTFGEGIFIYNSNNLIKVVQHDPDQTQSLSDNQVRALYEDSSGNIWIGTQNGLNFLSAENARNLNPSFKKYLFNQDNESGQDVLCIFESSDKQIWFGTKEGGLNKIVNGEVQNVPFLEESGQVTSQTVHAIEEDQDQMLWISTNHGLIRFDPMSETSRYYTEADGLASNEFNSNSSFKTPNGTMYFGSLGGITYFDPNSMVRNTFKPRVIIRDLFIGNERVRPLDQYEVLSQAIQYENNITLDYDQSIFTMHFALPNFVNPRKNKYVYRLKGLQEDYTVTTDNSATYTIQRPGKYVFEVKGQNSNGLWSDEFTSLVIVVEPAPWRTPLAFAFYAVSILVALYFLIKVIQNQYNLKHELLLEHQKSDQEKQLNRLKLEFFTNISHEFRTPLTLITGPLQRILQEYRGSRGLFRQLVTIEKNADQLLKLINQLMDFRKLENNEFKLKAAEGNFVNFAKEIFLSFKSHAKNERYTYEFIADREDIQVYFDRDKMERVLYNLISNAFKYSRSGGSISVKIHDSGELVKVVVSDDGIGFDKKDRPKLFHRFYQIDAAGDKRNPGSGIGLSLVRGLVELHGGKVSAHSDGENKGSEFIVELRKGAEHLSEEHLLENFQSSESIMPYTEGVPEIKEPEQIDLETEIKLNASKKVLIVEDNEQLRSFMADVLGSYKILTASNGKEGLERAIAEVPDIIISDVMMPEMDGISLCSEIKSNVITSHIPVILLTARTSLIFKYQGLESGADDYINKPFNIREFILKVKNLLSVIERLKSKFKQESGINPSEVTITSLDEELMEKAISIVDKNISNEFFDISLFSTELGLSRTMLFSKIKAWTDMTPNEFILTMRMKRAAQLLEKGKANVSQVCYEVGYKNPKYFSKCFQKYHNMTPTAFSKRFSIPESN